MADREKVKKGLECCKASTNDDPFQGCSECPYNYISISVQDCRAVLSTDALSLLKEQEAEAKWIYGEDKTGVDGWRCSECDFFEPWFYEFTDDIDFIRFYEHCPKCGKRMTSYTGKPTQERR